MPAFRLACLAYFSVSIPASILGLLWPSIRLSFHQPVAALGVLLAVGITGEVIAGAATGRLPSRLAAVAVPAAGCTLIAVALATEAVAPLLALFAGGMVVFGIGFGLLDAALNAHAARHFGARQINWMHASYGAGAMIGPVLAAVLLDSGLSWRGVYGILAAGPAVAALGFAAAHRARVAGPLPATGPVNAIEPVTATGPVNAIEPAPATGPPGPAGPVPALLLLGSLAFTAVAAGVESGAGIWAFVFLTDGRGLTRDAAGAAVSAYWAMMFAGRAVLGPVADRVGAPRVLGAAVAGVAAGAALMALPGPRAVAVAGLLLLGAAAAPVFPLFTLTTAHRIGAGAEQQTSRAVSLQVAVSAAGSAAIPAGIGLATGALTATALGPLLLLLSVIMSGVYVSLTRFGRTRRPAARPGQWG